MMALAKRLGLSLLELREMSYVTFINILISSIEDNDTSDGVRTATKEDITKYFG